MPGNACAIPVPPVVISAKAADSIVSIPAPWSVARPVVPAFEADVGRIISSTAYTTALVPATAFQSVLPTTVILYLLPSVLKSSGSIAVVSNAKFDIW